MECAVGNSFFNFNGKFYKQTDGLGMGLPLSPTFADIFMSFHEKIWLDSCPSEFKPIFYRRYVDDTFLLFRSPSHVNLFFNFLNSKHRNIKFTMESERDASLSFLDCVVTRRGRDLECGVFRKNTFTGLDLSYFSFTPHKFKVNSIHTALVRAFNICSNHTNLNREFTFLQSFFKDNGYPLKLFFSQIQKFIKSKTAPAPIKLDVPKKQMYLRVPFFGPQSDTLANELQLFLSKFFYHINFTIVMSNKFTIGSFFRSKDSLGVGMRSNVVYKYSCSPSCGSQYVGCTSRNLRMRISEHMGRSFRTGEMLLRPSHSSIRAHCESTGELVLKENFTVLGGAENFTDLRILESLFIKSVKPDLNDMSSSFPLKIT